MTSFDYDAAGIEERVSSPFEIDSVLTAANDPRAAGLYSENGNVQEFAVQQALMPAAFAAAFEHCKSIDDVAKLLAAVNSQKNKIFHWPIYLTVGQTITRDRIANSFPGEGQWLLAGFTYWADPSASGNVQVNMTINGWGIPMALLASKTDVSTRQVGIPMIDNPEFSWTTTGGVSGDRVAIIAIFERAA